MHSSTPIAPNEERVIKIYNMSAEVKLKIESVRCVTAHCSGQRTFASLGLHPSGMS
jgi:hypothetical protein